MLLHTVVLGSLTALAHADAFIPGGTVKIAAGEIKGRASVWKPEVSEYLGIPYAEPPVGALRWVAPQKYNGTGKVIEATRRGNACIAGRSTKPSPSDALDSSALTGPELVQSEDCLNLNIWTKPQSGEKKKAVMLWFHGGAFVVGSGSNKGYDGGLLADEKDVVVVGINYRLGIFGFPGQSFMKDKNPGLLDQRMAVEWVRDNIEQFGGDPARITIIGHSAGSTSVDYYYYAYTKDPIIAGAILQSGTSGLMEGTGSNTTEAWFRIATELGCGNIDTGAASADCLRGRSAYDIHEAMVSTAPAFSYGGFLPRPDNITVFSDYAARLNRGDFIRVPMMIGNTENELAIFAEFLSPLVPLGVNRGIKSLTTYFSCPAGDTAKARAQFVPTWRYSYAGEFPNQDLTRVIQGPWHGSEIGMVFGTSDMTRRRIDTPEQKILALKMRNAWTEFAKNPTSGLEGVWPKYDPEKPSVVILGGKDTAKITYKTSAQYDESCGSNSWFSRAMGQQQQPVTKRIVVHKLFQQHIY